VTAAGSSDTRNDGGWPPPAEEKTPHWPVKPLSRWTSSPSGIQSGSVALVGHRYPYHWIVVGDPRREFGTDRLIDELSLRMGAATGVVGRGTSGSQLEVRTSSPWKALLLGVCSIQSKPLQPVARELSVSMAMPKENS
jgi:hypothetical protein